MGKWRMALAVDKLIDNTFAQEGESTHVQQLYNYNSYKPSKQSSTPSDEYQSEKRCGKFPCGRTSWLLTWAQHS